MKLISPFVLALTPVAAAGAARTARGGALRFWRALRGLARGVGERLAAVLGVGGRPRGATGRWRLGPGLLYPGSGWGGVV